MRELAHRQKRFRRHLGNPHGLVVFLRFSRDFEPAGRNFKKQISVVQICGESNK
jgi:hypothetical protein